MATLNDMARKWGRGLLLVVLFASLPLLYIEMYHVQTDSLVGSYRGETLGMRYGPLLETGEFEVRDVRSDGPAAKAGIRAGDAVDFDVLQGDAIAWQPGEKVSLTVEHDGERFRRTLTAATPPPRAERDNNGTAVTGPASWLLLAFNIVTLLLMTVLLVSGLRNRAALLLGCCLLLFFLPDLDTVPRWATSAVMFLLWIPLSVIGVVAWPLFALEISGGNAWRGHARIVLGIAAVLAAISLAGTLVRIFDVPSTLLGNRLNFYLVIALLVLTLATIGINYRRSEHVVRNRLKIFFAAFGVLFVGLLAVQGVVLLGFSDLVNWLIPLTISGFVGLLSYAVLSKRVFDFNFAINRTLVYGASAFTLLVVFGLVEYIAKSMIPVAWPTAGHYVTAGLAVLLFLAFHHLHHWFEHHIERLFFGSWHRAEAALRRFVDSAGHFERIPSLGTSLVEAMCAYAQGAAAALYLHESDGSYRRLAGEVEGAPPVFDDDDPVFALMRAEREPIDLAGAGSGTPGALALPMLDHGWLTGFVLMDVKPDGIGYRPDEVENLGFAAQKVGLDLRALHARIMEERNGRLTAEVASLTAERDTLKKILTAAPRARTA